MKNSGFKPRLSYLQEQGNLYVKSSQKYILWKQYNSSLRSKQISKMPPIYHKDIQTLTVESFKVNSSICSEIVSDIFFTGTGIHNKPM